jgi:hypothetical protein
LKLSEDEEDDWYTLQLLGVQFEDYTTCDGLLRFVESGVDQVLDQHLTRPEEEPEKEEEEVAEQSNIL